jgi:hypothetical protein
MSSLMIVICIISQAERKAKENDVMNLRRWLDDAQGQLQNTQTALTLKEEECRDLLYDIQAIQVLSAGTRFLSETSCTFSVNVLSYVPETSHVNNIMLSHRGIRPLLGIVGVIQNLALANARALPRGPSKSR